MVNEALVWAIFLLPLGSFVLIALVIRPFLNRWPFLAALGTIAALTASTVLAVVTLRGVIVHHGEVFESWNWLSFGGATIQMGLLVDPLTAVMLVVVTSISLLIQIYSVGYMQGDPGFARYFAYMSLFTASMLGLVLSSNIVQLYAFWELVGVSSYLLIGFWHERPAAAAAAKKAFIVTRIGDVGFLIAILYLFLKADDFAAVGLNAFHIPDIWQAAQPVAAGAAVLGGAALTWMALGIFAGAAGKSGQFPLHAWLPDAMEGPTPVSALIHAATMVAAGVFLVARFFPVFQQSDSAMAVVALIGAFTALMAATMALVMNDIKRVMAYSTVSQLGYMMAALGLGAYAPAIFHLVTHAVFKALLFLGAGSVNHASGTFDMTSMGGLRKYMPATYLLVMIASLSLIGIIPLAGFWSKDEILLAAFDGNRHFDDWINIAVFVGLIVGVVFTGFYTVRMVMMTFYGEFKGGVDQEIADPPSEEPVLAAHAPDHAGASDQAVDEAHEDGGVHHGGVHLAESPLVMVVPMGVLGVGAVVVGFVINPQWINFLGVPVHWVTGFVADGLLVATGGEGHAELPAFSWAMAGISTAAAVGGALLGLAVYGLRRDQTREPLRVLGPVHTLLSQKYYVDALYENLIVRRSFYQVFAAFANWLDRRFVDGIVDFVGWFFRNIGSAVARLQTGQVQAYGTAVALGSLLIILGFLLSS